MNNAGVVEAVVQFKVPFHDADMMKVAWHGHYLKYFEIARCELLDKIDYNYQQMSDSGYAWPVIDLRVKYIKPAKFGMLIQVAAKIIDYENRLKIEYLVTDFDSGERLTKGYTTQVAVSIKDEEMCMVSPKILFTKLGIK